MKTRPLLEGLSLSGQSSGPSLYLVLEIFTSPNLKRLNLSRYGVGRSSGDVAAPWMRPPFAINPSALEVLLPLSRYHTGSVTSLGFRIRVHHPMCLNAFCFGPHVSLICQSDGSLTRKTRGIMTCKLQRLLNIHRHSSASIWG